MDNIESLLHFMVKGENDEVFWAERALLQYEDVFFLSDRLLSIVFIELHEEYIKKASLVIINHIFSRLVELDYNATIRYIIGFFDYLPKILENLMPICEKLINIFVEFLMQSRSFPYESLHCSSILLYHSLLRYYYKNHIIEKDNMEILESISAQIVSCLNESCYSFGLVYKCMSYYIKLDIYDSFDINLYMMLIKNILCLQKYQKSLYFKKCSRYAFEFVSLFIKFYHSIMDKQLTRDIFVFIIEFINENIIDSYYYLFSSLNLLVSYDRTWLFLEDDQKKLLSIFIISCFYLNDEEKHSAFTNPQEFISSNFLFCEDVYDKKNMAYSLLGKLVNNNRDSVYHIVESLSFENDDWTIVSLQVIYSIIDNSEEDCSDLYDDVLSMANSSNPFIRAAIYSIISILDPYQLPNEIIGVLANNILCEEEFCLVYLIYSCSNILECLEEDFMISFVHIFIGLYEKLIQYCSPELLLSISISIIGIGFLESFDWILFFELTIFLLLSSYQSLLPKTFHEFKEVFEAFVLSIPSEANGIVNGLLKIVISYNTDNNVDTELKFSILNILVSQSIELFDDSLLLLGLCNEVLQSSLILFDDVSLLVKLTLKKSRFNPSIQSWLLQLIDIQQLPQMFMCSYLDLLSCIIDFFSLSNMIADHMVCHSLIIQNIETFPNESSQLLSSILINDPNSFSFLEQCELENWFENPTYPHFILALSMINSCLDTQTLIRSMLLSAELLTQNIDYCGVCLFSNEFVSSSFTYTLSLLNNNPEFMEEWNYKASVFIETLLPKILNTSL